jgi:transposase
MDMISEILPYRIDDIPLLLALVKQIDLAAVIDECVPTHGNTLNHNELTNGEALCIWLVYILTQSDHRKLTVEEWVRHHSPMLSKLWGVPVPASDFTDDRLSTRLSRLFNPVSQCKIDQRLFEHTVYVYDLYADHIRLDATACSGHHDVQEQGMMQLGHSKDGRDDLAQFKVMAAATGRAPYISGQFYSGEKADDPLYVPLFERIVCWLPDPGMLLVGDCKMCALETRAAIVNARHLYYMPLAKNHVGSRLYTRWIHDAVTGTLPDLTAIWRGEELLGYGYEFTRDQRSEGQEWTERVHVVRSLNMVPSGEETIDHHVQRAREALFKLTPAPRQGQAQVKDANELQKSIHAIVKQYHLNGVLTVTWECDETYKGGQDFRLVITKVDVDADKLRDLKHHTGWRVFITNTKKERLALDAGVLLYRKGAGQGVERMYAMFKGSPIGISPMFVRKDDQIIGLAYLLTLALRVMTYFETMVRDALAKNKEQLPDYTPDGKSSGNPTAKTMLERIAKKGVILNQVRYSNGERHFHLSKLPPILSKILEVLNLSTQIYECLLE